MADQYFSANPASESRPRGITVRYGGADYPFTTDAGVFSRDDLDEGSRLLLDALPDLVSGQSGLDLGCGWGPVGTLWALRSPQGIFTLTDINERAAGLAEANLRRNGAANAHAEELLGECEKFKESLK